MIGNPVLSDNEFKKPVRERISIPRQGVSLESLTETMATYVREAVSFLAEGFDKSKLPESFDAIFAPRWELYIGGRMHENSLFSRAAWNLVCIWLLARGSSAVEESASFAECEEWFLGSISSHIPRLSSLVTIENVTQAKRCLLKLSIDQDFWDLFPYILQEVGPGSRSSVLRNPNNRVARAVKKRHGIFYTPSDVADYMVRSVVANCPIDIAHARCFDPACGTGVFLLALCREAKERTNRKFFDCFEFVTTNLFGCDISAHAVEACSFVLLQQTLIDIKKRGLNPWSAWHVIRLNMANIDSLRLYQDSLQSDIDSMLREEQKNLLLSAANWVEPKKQHLRNAKMTNSGHSLFPNHAMIGVGKLFPEVENGFHILIGNPPYSKIGDREDCNLLSNEYHSFSSGHLLQSYTRHSMLILY